VDGRFFRVMAEYFHPGIEVIPLKLPPRQGEGDICCRWEFRWRGAEPSPGP